MVFYGQLFRLGWGVNEKLKGFLHFQHRSCVFLLLFLSFTAATTMNSFLTIPSLATGQLPIVYDPAYNMTAWGLERLHPFDGRKFGRIVEMLGIADRVVRPVMLPWAFLEATHSKAYLDSLHSSSTIARILELPIGLIPAGILRRIVVEKMRLHYSGTVQAAWLAMEHGWAVNLGGGFHHASRDAGHGFCMFNDLSAATWSLLEGVEGRRAVERVMIVDLDAHQGDGHEEDLRDEVEAGRVYIMDAYDPTIFPGRKDLEPWMGARIAYSDRDDGTLFLRALRRRLPEALEAFRPTIVLYNAGTDPLEGDPVSGLNQTADCIWERDVIVWAACRERRIPICMTLSGGYQKRTAEVVAASLRGLGLLA